MKILIVGRTASGKDTIANYLTNTYGLQPVISYTTRPKRTYETDGVEHYFINKEDINKEEYKNKAATTWINNYFYFATKEEIHNKDIYVIDSNGVKEILDNMPDEQFVIVYVSRPFEDRMNAYTKRGNVDREEFFERDEAETKQFDAFEVALFTSTLALNDNVCYVLRIDNSKDLSDTLKQVDSMYNFIA